MLHGHNIIGFTDSADGKETFQSFSTLKGENTGGNFFKATDEEVNTAIAKAALAFTMYSETNFEVRASFLEAIAAEIMAIGDELLNTANLETGLPMARLTGERDRTTNQLKLFAALLREGSWADAVIDTALPDRKPMPRPDLRRLLYPVGPVVVFGASNFPFAFSTAGGDVAAALAAGCPVIVKAHTAHLGTNELVAKAVQTAAKQCGMPDGVFSSLNGDGAHLGQRLATDPVIKAIAFTGSYKAGMALYAAATQRREEPIPVYAEMSSINPVVLLPDVLAEKAVSVATAIAGSISLGVGQFCTNPGLLFVLQDAASEAFVAALRDALAAIPANVMLNKTICAAYYNDRSKFNQAKGIETILAGPDESAAYKGSTALWKISAADFMAQAELQEEVFGPCSLVVVCKNKAELEKAIQSVHGQLTGSVYGTEEELPQYTTVINGLKQKVGRLLFNTPPTGVEVCHAMVHGGPFPATTDSRTTSVGTEAIRRFVRPVCYQDCPPSLLPYYLRNENEAGIMRKVNGAYTRDAI